MVTIAQIQESLERGDLTPRQSRAIAEAIEIAQRKVQEEVETSLRSWMENCFVTKEEFHKELGTLRAEIIKWMFIFWVGQIMALATLFKLLK